MNRIPPKLPGAVVVGLILAIVLDTFIQITWKLSVSPVPADASVAATIRGALASPLL
jgi:hypothetical protein